MRYKVLVSLTAFPPQVVRFPDFRWFYAYFFAGTQGSVQCSISREATLPRSTLLEVMWLDPENNTITNSTTYSITGSSSTHGTTLTSTLTFLHITTSQGGLYSCAVNMTIPAIVTDHQVIKQIDLRVTS